MTNLQTISVGSIAFLAAAWIASGRKIEWTDRAGWISAASIAWAFVIAWAWNVGETPAALIIALASTAAGALVG